MNEPLSVVVCCFNEEVNVGPVLTELVQWLDEHEPNAEVVFVDDGSTDRSTAVARGILQNRSARFCRHETNRGLGAAVRTGFEAASGQWVTFLPADGQIEPMAIGTLRRAASADPAPDLVLSVYDSRNDGLHRKVLSFSVRALITVIHGVRLRSDGPYLARREVFLRYQLPSESFFLNFEFPILAIADDVPYCVTTIRCRPRLQGFSKSTGIKRIVGVATDLLRLRVRRLRGRDTHR